MPYFSTLFLLKKWGIIVHLSPFLRKTFSFITYIHSIYSIKEYIYYYINRAHTRVREKDFLIFFVR